MNGTAASGRDIVTASGFWDKPEKDQVSALSAVSPKFKSAGPDVQKAYLQQLRGKIKSGALPPAGAPPPSAPVNGSDKPAGAAPTATDKRSFLQREWEGPPGAVVRAGTSALGKSIGQAWSSVPEPVKQGVKQTFKPYLHPTEPMLKDFQKPTETLMGEALSLADEAAGRVAEKTSPKSQKWFTENHGFFRGVGEGAAEVGVDLSSPLNVVMMIPSLVASPEVATSKLGAFLLKGLRYGFTASLVGGLSQEFPEIVKAYQEGKPDKLGKATAKALADIGLLAMMRGKKGAKAKGEADPTTKGEAPPTPPGTPPASPAEAKPPGGTPPPAPPKPAEPVAAKPVEPAPKPAATPVSPSQEYVTKKGFPGAPSGSTVVFSKISPDGVSGTVTDPTGKTSPVSLPFATIEKLQADGWIAPRPKTAGTPPPGPQAAPPPAKPPTPVQAPPPAPAPAAAPTPAPVAQVPPATPTPAAAHEPSSPYLRMSAEDRQFVLASAAKEAGVDPTPEMMAAAEPTLAAMTAEEYEAEVKPLLEARDRAAAEPAAPAPAGAPVRASHFGEEYSGKKGPVGSGDRVYHDRGDPSDRNDFSNDLDDSYSGWRPVGKVNEHGRIVIKSPDGTRRVWVKPAGLSPEWRAKLGIPEPSAAGAAPPAAAPTPTTEAEHAAAGMKVMGAGNLREAVYGNFEDLIAKGTPWLIKRPAAMALAKADPYIVLRENPDGTATVVGVRPRPGAEPVASAPASEAPAATVPTKTKAEQIASGMKGFGAGVRVGSRELWAGMLAKGEEVRLTKTVAIEAAKGDPQIVWRDNPDGSLSILEIKGEAPAATPPPAPVTPPDTTAGPVVTPPDTTAPPAKPRASKSAKSSKIAPSKKGAGKGEPPPTPESNVAPEVTPRITAQADTVFKKAQDGGMKGFRVQIKDAPGIKGKVLSESTITLGQSTPEGLAQLIASTPGATTLDIEPVGNPKGVKRWTETLGGEEPPKAPGPEAGPKPLAPDADPATTEGKQEIGEAVKKFWTDTEGTSHIAERLRDIGAGDWLDGMLDFAVRKVPPQLREDARQEALIAFWEKSQDYDPSKGVASLRSYANHRVQGAVLDFLRKHGEESTGVSRWERDQAKKKGQEPPESRVTGLPEFAGEVFAGKEPSPYTLAELNEHFALVQKYRDHLTGQEQKAVFGTLYGMEDDAIAKLMGISEKSVWQYREKGAAKIGDVIRAAEQKRNVSKFPTPAEPPPKGPGAKGPVKPPLLTRGNPPPGRE